MRINGENVPEEPLERVAKMTQLGSLRHLRLTKGIRRGRGRPISATIPASSFLVFRHS